MTDSTRSVIVTGGSGKLGRAVVREFAEQGYSVVCVDRARPAELPDGARFLSADLTDFGQAVEALSYIDDAYGSLPVGSGADAPALVHLAAIPAPGLRPNAATYANNTAITYNLFSAARLAGLTRIVFASSETLLGLPFDTTPPPYFPVDEEYPVRPQSSYSLSKAVDEEIARHFARWSPQAGFLGLRFSNVMAPEDYADFPGFDSDARLRSWNSWGYIDARDGALACRLAVESDIVGAENFIIANAETVMSRPSLELVAEVFPDVPVRGDIPGTATLLSIDKARSMLGFEPQHPWRESL
ncbi:NAD-dependent epimerase/dehydratase family protein [Naasia lichenicola]|uniref:NAD(P)-dependent oxidoreductase n=1 Tax=Naasia lichenicola TaxID=2565933 RepID=A0A4S4FIH9_9MICO|nr:NAD(P)-dependent oxidoreductase [Naasia lichenicola]THG30059.1 NAD(P)-dependent oxidoreductase [Naasia lichenicola]